MKTQVTIDLSDDQRIAVGLLESGHMRPATREEVRSYTLGIMMPLIQTATDVTDAQRERIENDIRKTLGMPTVDRIDELDDDE